MKRIDEDFKYFIGQGENSDLFVSVVEFDRKFDHYFEMDYSKAESNLITIDDDLYPGLDDSALLTSYLDYFQIHEDLPLNETLVDLGAGYCRGSLLFDALGKNRCISIEVAANRVVGAQKIVPEDIIIADMISPDFDIPDSNFYFIYLPVSKVLYALFLILPFACQSTHPSQMGWHA